jgi:hypothetical protein
MTRKRIQRIITQEDESRIVNLYKSGLSGREILEEINWKVKTTKTIYDILRKWEVPIKRGPSSYNPIRHNYFSCIDSREKAYLLGFLVSDGWVHIPRNQIGLGVAKKDKWVPSLLKRECNAAPKIIIRPGGKKINPQGKLVQAQDLHQLIMSSKKMVEDLMDLGVYENKTGREILPIVESYWQSHVFRGLLDGDGSIYKHSNGQDTCIRFIGGPHLTAQISLYLKMKLKVSYQFPNKKRETTLWYVEWSNKEDCKKIAKFLYHNSDNLRIKRKYEKAQSLIS